MIVIDTYSDGSFIPVYYERKHVRTYLVQQLKSSLLINEVDGFEIDLDSHYELEIPRGIRVHKDLKKFFKITSGDNYRLIVIKCSSLQIKRGSFNVANDDIMFKDVIQLPYRIERKLLGLMEKCSIRSQE